MTSDHVLSRLRLFLLTMAALLLLGTVAELAFIEHTAEPVQWLPFILSAAGLAAIAALRLRPQRGVVMAVRGIMGVVTVGSAFGVLIHVVNNIEFLKEIKPNAAAGEVLSAALGGANPLLAPGMLGLAAVLAIAATYYHPALNAK